jgi:Histone methylation protein DOT1
MTTLSKQISGASEVRDWQRFIAQVEADSSLLEPGQLRRRIDMLDELDRRFGEFESQECKDDTAHGLIYHRVKAIQTRLETLNAELYQSIRMEIRRGASPHRVFESIRTSACLDEAGSPSSGPGFDPLDELVSGILQFSEPSETNIQLGPEMVFYQPTPVRHILDLITVSALSRADVLVDLGSGLGHVPLLASMLTGSQSIGIEVQAAHVASAQECAQSVGLRDARFIQQDARVADLSCGTVFYLYSPFTGSILANVLDKLRMESTRRSIKICTFGPCTSIVAKEPWLRASAPPDTERITLFRTRF